jgi:hypothetical protein
MEYKSNYHCTLVISILIILCVISKNNNFKENKFAKENNEPLKNSIILNFTTWNLQNKLTIQHSYVEPYYGISRVHSNRSRLHKAGGKGVGLIWPSLQRDSPGGIGCQRNPILWGSSTESKCQEFLWQRFMI